MTDIVYEYLSDKDKNEIIISHIKSHEFTKFNLEMSKEEFLSGQNINQEEINEFDLRIIDINAKIATLKQQQSMLDLG